MNTAPGARAAVTARPRRGRKLARVPLIVALALAAPYALMEDEPELLTEAARADARGSFAALSHGRTYYEIAGPAHAPMVVLVHGTTIPSFVWDPNFAALARAGRRVVRYDLYGRGLSDRPDARYDLDFHVAQLDELLSAIAPGRAIDLVGLSMGAIVVSEFARRHPQRARRLVLIDPAGVGTALPLAARIAMAPGVGEYIMRVFGTRQLTPSRRNLFRPERFPDFDAAYLRTIRFRGSRRAVLESLRNVPFNGYERGFRELGASSRPVLLVWGRQDRVIPFPVSERVRELVRPKAFVAVEEAGHLSNFERPDLVNPALIDFLGGHSP